MPGSFSSICPACRRLRSRVTQIMEAKTISYGGVQYRKGKIFAMKREPPKQQAFLIVLPSLEAVDQARVLVDPNSLDAKGSTAIDWYVPSADGEPGCRVAFPRRNRVGRRACVRRSDGQGTE